MSFQDQPHEQGEVEYDITLERLLTELGREQVQDTDPTSPRCLPGLWSWGR
jgi:hypothetical protein